MTGGKQMTASCKHCGGEFTVKPPRTTYCSAECLEMGRRPNKRAALGERVCEICSKTFAPTSYLSRYCSAKCSHKPQFDKRNAERKAKHAEARLKRTCLDCKVNIGSTGPGAKRCSTCMHQREIERRRTWRATAAGKAVGKPRPRLSPSDKLPPRPPKTKLRPPVEAKPKPQDKTLPDFKAWNEHGGDLFPGYCGQFPRSFTITQCELLASEKGRKPIGQAYKREHSPWFGEQRNHKAS
jgi:hypothetical protein